VPHADRLVGPISEETRFWLNKAVPSSLERPVELNAYSTILRVIAAVTSRVFVDLPVSRDEDWIRTIENYTLDVFQVSMVLRTYHPFLRPFVAPWLNCIKHLNGQIERTEDRFGHVFAQKLAQPRGKEDGDNMIQWLVDSAEDEDRRPGLLIRKLLFLTLAATHTSTMSATHALYDLCAHPEYVEPLRTEIGQVIGAQGWTLQAINQLKLLDSFVKESQRVNHPGLREYTLLHLEFVTHSH
jgi:ent-kaurene oxidase